MFTRRKSRSRSRGRKPNLSIVTAEDPDQNPPPPPPAAAPAVTPPAPRRRQDDDTRSVSTTSSSSSRTSRNNGKPIQLVAVTSCRSKYYNKNKKNAEAMIQPLPER